MASTDIYENLVQPKGLAYRDEQVTSNSHYRDAIDQAPGRAAGNSRIWGDAGPAAQSRVIDELIAAGERADLKPREIAYVLATARVESGFNLDAAAGTTSATGLGQFIDRTGAAYGLNDANRGDLNKQAEALVAHYQDNARLALSRGQGEGFIYKYHHDGPVKDYGGLEIAQKQVLPYLDKYEKFVSEHQQKYGVEATKAEPSAERTSLPHGQTLHLGGEGKAVSELQSKLDKLGYTNVEGKSLKLDGSFGPNTQHAVKSFQRDNHFAEDGMAGPNTLKALDVKLKEQALAPHPRQEVGIQDSALYKQTHTALEKIDAQFGRQPDQLTNNAAAAVAVAAQKAGFSHIDHIEPGGPDNSKLFAVQGKPGTAHSKVIDVPTVEAMNTPMAQSAKAFEETRQAQQQAVQQPQQVTQASQQQAAPSLSH